MANKITRTFPMEFVYDILDNNYGKIETVVSKEEVKTKKEEKAILEEKKGAFLVLKEVITETREMSVEDFIANSTKI